MKKTNTKNIFALVALSVSILLIGCSDYTEQDNLFRQTEFGQVRGYENSNTLIWLGIPYAGDTSGENRWQAPTDPKPWSDLLDATIAGKFVAQPAGGSEDGLKLDIYRANTNKRDLPVLVYIHGGNNQTGHSQQISGVSFVKNHDAIFVSINYRLGVLGFNPLPALRNGTDEENSGNYTLLDFAKAFDWVRNNIEYFGGDANNITVSGYSAGGRDIMAMLISPLFKDKFDKAIAFSGGMTLADPDKSAQVFAKAFAPLVVEDQIKTTTQEAEQWLLTDGNDVRDYLYGLKTERLVNLMGGANIRMSVFPHLYTDGVVLPKAGFDSQNLNAVPLMMVTGENDFSLFSAGDQYFKSHIKNGEISDQDIAKQYAFTNKYGGQLYAALNLDESAEKLSANYYDAPIYGLKILFGEDANVVGNPMSLYGSFHGVY